MKATVSQVNKERAGIWLKRVGWERNPFACSDSPISPVRRAEDERETLGQHFRWAVIRIGANDIERYEKLLDDESHSVLFAGTGEGKSACRFMVADEVQKHGILVAEILEFDRHPRSVEEHAREIERRILQALGEQQGTFGAPEPLSALVEISDAAKERGFQATFVLIDDVTEGFGPESTNDEIEQVIINLFDHRLFEIPGLYFKFFLPDSLAGRLSVYPVITSRKYPIDLLHVRWTEQALHQLLREKIFSVGRKGEDSFLPLSDDGTGQPFDVDQELIKMALSQPGAPRNLNILACNLIYAHARNEPDPEKFRLTKRDLEEAKMLPFQAKPSSPEKELASKPTTEKQELNPFWLLALPIAVISAGGLAIFVYRDTGSVVLIGIAFIFATLFLIVIGVFALTGGQFEPEGALDFINRVLDFLGGAFTSLIGRVAGPPRRDSDGQSNSDVDEDQQHLRELIAEKRRRLQKRKLQKAKLGISTPPEVLNEIEDLRREIAELEAQLNNQ